MIPDWAGDVPRETLERLEGYVALLEKWNRTINLVAKNDDIWSRHIWDSYQLLPLIPPTAKTLIDLGSGAGLPGLVIAIARPMAVTLVERDRRKTSFLREAARSLGLKDVVILAEDAGTLGGKYDVITARALASLNALNELAAPLMGTNAICLFPKGRNFASEVEEAGRDWSFDCQCVPSRTQEDSSIVSLSKLKRKG
ncbi:MAG: 16S rRNA (guanine(527)-N(7))-methyltransferase RsmG [Alphaproteobacteria bacterium]